MRTERKDFSGEPMLTLFSMENKAEREGSKIEMKVRQ